ncbi:MAG TPA: amidohydrolase family protein [Ramlibacter sp.]|nr:amidohydrolase family protein [Ramlibacter sp.]
MNEIRGEAVAAPNSTGSQPPQTAAPEGAVDCHMHIFDPRFPFIAGRNPGVGTVEDYRLYQRRLGLSRCIVVGASSHGLDNSCLLDSLETFGDSARGVATISRETTEAELQRLHSKGVRGIRVNFGRVKVVPSDLNDLAERIKPLGWHLQTHMLADSIVENEALLAALPVTLVIDHIGRAPQPGGLDHPVARTLERLLRAGNTWVKLSHYYEDEGKGVDYADYVPLIKHLISVAPDRLVWASDWPHGTQANKPDGAALFDQIATWAPDPAMRRRILVDNPSALYWRDSADAAARSAR